MGISCNVIKPKEVAKLHPHVNIHDLVGALHLPGDAVVSPPDINHALAVAAAAHGERVTYESRTESKLHCVYMLHNVIQRAHVDFNLCFLFILLLDILLYCYCFNLFVFNYIIMFYLFLLYIFHLFYIFLSQKIIQPSMNKVFTFLFSFN